MITKPLDILTMFPVRKTKHQKQAFRDAVQTYAEQLNYSVTVEKGMLGSRNVIIGDSSKANYLITAHYDTSARRLLPNFLTPFNPVVFALQRILSLICIPVTAFLLSTLVSLIVFLGCVLWATPDSGLLVALAVFLLWYVEFIVFCVLLLLWNWIGPSNPSNANDNTSGVVTLLEIARTLPENQRHKVCFVLFDLEEKGLRGSFSYRTMHKEATDQQLILNLDCVGDGDFIRMIPTKKLKQDRKKLASLYKACGYMGKKSVLVCEKGFGIYPSDQRCFPYGVGICALKKGKMGLYLGKIHTSKDTVLDETNVNILRAALTSFICCDEVN